MKRTPLARRSPFKRTTLKTKSAALKRTSGPRKQKPETKLAEERLRKIVWERDGGECQMLVWFVASGSSWIRCPLPITELNPIDVVHVNSRALFPEIKHEPDNCTLGCRAAHDAYDNRRTDIKAIVTQERFDAAEAVRLSHGKNRRSA